MSAVRMDGKALSAKVRGSILAETEALKKQGVTPGLAVSSATIRRARFTSAIRSAPASSAAFTARSTRFPKRPRRRNCSV